MEFNPPIENRETDELIIISKSTTDDYQARAIELAQKELYNRNVSQADIDNRYNELFDEHERMVEQTITEMEVEDYNLLEKIRIVLFWPKELFRDWYLRRDGYTLKAKNRIKLLLIGVALYVLAFLIS